MINSAILGVCGRRRNSGTVAPKFQIPTTDCDVTSVCTCLVGTDKIAVLGYVNNIVGTSKIDTVDISSVSGSTNPVVVLFDATTGLIDWISVIDTGAGNSEYTAQKNSNTIRSDGTNIFITTARTGVSTNAHFIHSILVADGSLVATSPALGYNGNKSAIYLSSSYVYIVYRGASNVAYISRIDKDLSTGLITLNISANIYSLKDFNIDSDGSYIWVYGGQSSDTVDVGLRVNLDLTSPSIIDTFNPTEPFCRPVGFAIDGATRLVTYSGFDGTPTYVSYFTDISTTATGKAGKVCIANSSWYIRTSASSTLSSSEISKMNKTTLTPTWTVDHSASLVVEIVGIVYADSKHWTVGYTTGDFDGNNAGNTEKNIIIFEIDDTDGSIK